MRVSKCLVPVLVVLLVEGSSARPSLTDCCRDSLPVPPDIFKKGAEFIGSNLNPGPLPVSSRVVSSSASATANWNGAASATAKANSQAFSGSGANAIASATANAQAGACAKEDNCYGQTEQQPIRGGNQLLTGPGQSIANADANVDANADANADANTNTNTNGNDASFDTSNLHRSGGTLILQGAAIQTNDNATASSIGTYNTSSSGTPSFGGSSVGNGNAAAIAEATATANSETNSSGTGHIGAQNPLHGGNPQGPGVYENVQGNGHPGELGHYVTKGETSTYANASANAGNQGKVNDTREMYPSQRIPPRQFVAQQGWPFFPFPGPNGHLGNGPHVTHLGTTYQYGDRNVESIETYNVGTSNQEPVPEQFAKPRQWWLFVPFQAANAGGGAGPMAFGGSGPSYGNWVPGVNSASNAYVYGGSNVDGTVGINAGNTGIVLGGSDSFRSGLGRYDGSNGGSVSVNAKADAVATTGASSGSWTDGSNGSRAYQQDSFGGLSSAISNAHSNAFGGSTSSSGKSTTNFFGNAMAQSSSSAISTDGRSSASSYTSASAHTNV